MNSFDVFIPFFHTISITTVTIRLLVHVMLSITKESVQVNIKTSCTSNTQKS